jgi:glycosyltransferase involved in cell wall biosynthesis
VREAMMLGKPVVCYLRDEWLERMRRQVPGYIDELPVVSATPETVEGVLKDLVNDPERRRALGERSRAFALKYHSAAAGARRMDEIYRALLSGAAPAAPR